MKRRSEEELSATGFVDRLGRVIKEFGSRYALAKASGIPASTLQGYQAGSKPGMDALVTLARTANVDLRWLLTGRGDMRPVGLMSGAAWADVVMADQHDPVASLNIPVIVNSIPFSRHFLEKSLGLEKPSNKTLLAIEAQWNLYDIARGDLVLIDRNQANLSQDGVYLLHLPGFALRGIVRGVGEKIRVVGPAHDSNWHSDSENRENVKGLSTTFEVHRRELLGDGRHVVSKVVGRAVWIGRTI